MAKSMYKCKHCICVVHNELAEEVVYCEITDEWMNVTLGECVGNCEQQAESEE